MFNFDIYGLSSNAQAVQKLMHKQVCDFGIIRRVN